MSIAKVGKLSCGLYWLLPIVSISVKLALKIAILYDLILLVGLTVVFGAISLLQYILSKQDREVSQDKQPIHIHKYTLMGMGLFFVSLVMAIKAFGNPKGTHEEIVWNAEEGLLYVALIGVVLCQLIVGRKALLTNTKTVQQSIETQQRDQALYQVVSSTKYRLVAILSIVDIVVLLLAALIKYHIGDQWGEEYWALDIMTICIAMSLLKFHTSDRMYTSQWRVFYSRIGNVCLAISLGWIVVVCLPFVSWVTRVQYIILGIVNMIAYGRHAWGGNKTT
ncbi:MAG: hypothetical protein LBK70_00265 [Clostridiales bacterium]|jgi:hypothetical protein|nr:hypothetical protein [Clostridiales bacterium]